MLKSTIKPFICLLAFCSFFLIQSSSAQNYSTAAGVRFGSPNSVTVKKFFTENLAGELYVGTRGFSTFRWFNISAALQKHESIDDVLEGLQWYYGAGATVYFWRYDFTTDVGSTNLGLQGYLGVEYTFEDVPICISVDWVPTIFLNNTFINTFGGGYGNVAVRYILNKG